MKKLLLPSLTLLGLVSGYGQKPLWANLDSAHVQEDTKDQIDKKKPISELISSPLAATESKNNSFSLQIGDGTKINFIIELEQTATTGASSAARKEPPLSESQPEERRVIEKVSQLTLQEIPQENPSKEAPREQLVAPAEEAVALDKPVYGGRQPAPCSVPSAASPPCAVPCTPPCVPTYTQTYPSVYSQPCTPNCVAPSPNSHPVCPSPYPSCEYLPIDSYSCPNDWQEGVPLAECDDTPCFEAPYPACGDLLSFSAEALVWKLRTEGLNYAYTGVINNGVTAGQETAFENVVPVCPEFKTGVRLGVDYLLACWDNWDVDLFWTGYWNQQRDESTRPALAEGVLIPLRMARTLGFNANRAEADFQFALNMFDLGLGRAFLVGEQLGLRPFAGLRGMWIRHQLDVRYDSPIAALVFVDTEDTVHSWSWGPRIGCDASWLLGCGFSLFTNIAFDLLWTHLDIAHREFLPSGAKRAGISENEYVLIPATNLFIGLGWDYLFCNGFALHLHLGWEQLYLFNASQYNTFIGLDTLPALSGELIHHTANLGLSGLTAGIAMGF